MIYQSWQLKQRKLKEWQDLLRGSPILRLSDELSRLEVTNTLSTKKLKRFNLSSKFNLANFNQMRRQVAEILGRSFPSLDAGQEIVPVDFVGSSDDYYPRGYRDMTREEREDVWNTTPTQDRWAFGLNGIEQCEYLTQVRRGQADTSLSCRLQKEFIDRVNELKQHFESMQKIFEPLKKLLSQEGLQANLTKTITAMSGAFDQIMRLLSNEILYPIIRERYCIEGPAPMLGAQIATIEQPSHYTLAIKTLFAKLKELCAIK